MAVYIALSSVVPLACLGVLVLRSVTVTTRRCPETTHWPAVDFVANCEVRRRVGEGRGGEGLVERLRGCRELGNGREMRDNIDGGVVVIS